MDLLHMQTYAIRQINKMFQYKICRRVSQSLAGFIYLFIKMLSEKLSSNLSDLCVRFSDAVFERADAAVHLLHPRSGAADLLLDPLQLLFSSLQLAVVFLHSLLQFLLLLLQRQELHTHTHTHGADISIGHHRDHHFAANLRVEALIQTLDSNSQNAARLVSKLRQGESNGADGALKADLFEQNGQIVGLKHCCIVLFRQRYQKGVERHCG